MRRINILLAVLIVFTLSGCQKGPEDFTFEIDPNLGNEFSNFGDFLLEIEDNIGHELKIECDRIYGTLNYSEGDYVVRNFSIYSESVIQDQDYNQDSIYCSDLMWDVETEGFLCKYSYNQTNDYTFEDIYVTIEEIAEFIESVDSTTLESLNEMDWQLSLFDQDHDVLIGFNSYDNHVTDFDNGTYHYGLFTDDGFVTSGEHTLDGIYLDIFFFLDATDEFLTLYFLLE